MAVTPLAGRLGTQNYATWAVQCRMALLKDGLWRVVERMKQVPNLQMALAAEVDDYQWKKEHALTTMVSRRRQSTVDSRQSTQASSTSFLCPY